MNGPSDSSPPASETAQDTGGNGPQCPGGNGAANLQTLAVIPAKKNWRRKETAPQIELTLAQSEETLVATRKRAEGWWTGSASLMALIVASLALRSGSGWMTEFSGKQLHAISIAVAVALGLALGSMWLTLRAANGPYRLDTRTRDYYTPHDGKQIFKRAHGAATNLLWGQVMLWAGVLVFCLAAFASWLLDPQSDYWLPLR